MKKTYLRVGVAAMACALGLAGCGGSSGQLLLGGYISGLTKETIVLQNNGAHDLTLSPLDLGANGQFFFKDLIGADEQYNVTVKSFPSNVESCAVQNGSGRSAFDVTNVLVTCTLKSHTLGGTVSGLNGASITVVNGTDKKVINANGTFTMDKPVGEDIPYGITVLPQTGGPTCSVANGSGTMRTTDIANVQIVCTGP